MREIFAGMIIAMLLVGGCSTTPLPEPIVKTVEVRVPVQVKRVCPDTICHVFKPTCTLPVFVPDPANPKRAILSEDDQRKLRCYVRDALNWGEGMRAFNEAP